jgi:hypothetical protein
VKTGWSGCFRPARLLARWLALGLARWLALGLARWLALGLARWLALGLARWLALGTAGRRPGDDPYVSPRGLAKRSPKEPHITFTDAWKQ